VPAPAPHPVIDLRRSADAQLEVSRIAADLFWRDGVSATHGEDIAAAAGISTRTLWRYFRAKEACAEPVLAACSRRFVERMATWPRDVDLETHLRTADRPTVGDAADDDLRVMRLVELGAREPALRAAWLIACDAVERELLGVVADRLGLDPHDPHAVRITAAVGAAVRAVSERVSVAVVTGRSPGTRVEIDAELGDAVREASGGRLGDAITEAAR
jgi:AcrR family transcriptional regulator